VVIGGALNRQLERDLPGALTHCREYIIAGAIWYAADSLAERVPGPALVYCYEPALSLISSWSSDENRWICRASGVAVHFWAKRAHGAPEQLSSAEQLLNFLEPMVSERNYDAVKGVGRRLAGKIPWAAAQFSYLTSRKKS
jgi:hypothetical protein